MTEYEALFAYFFVTLVIFLGGLLWVKYRKSVKRRLGVEDYRQHHTEDHRPA